MKLTCSWVKVFLRTDLLEAPYDDFLRFLEVGFWPSMAGRFLGLGLGWELHVIVGFALRRVVIKFGVVVSWEVLRGLRKREEGTLK